MGNQCTVLGKKCVLLAQIVDEQQLKTTINVSTIQIYITAILTYVVDISMHKKEYVYSEKHQFAVWNKEMSLLVKLLMMPNSFCSHGVLRYLNGLVYFYFPFEVFPLSLSLPLFLLLWYFSVNPNTWWYIQK